LQTAPGYMGNLSDKQVMCLTRLKALAIESVGPLSSWLLKHGETEEHFLLRFLRARDFNVMKALAMLENDIRWRKAGGISELAEKTEEAAHACSNMVRQYMPWRHLGYDTQGRPVIAKHMGQKTVLKDALQHCSNEELVRYHVWQQECFCSLLASQSQQLGVCIEQWMVIIDAKGWHVGLASRQAFTFLRAMATVDSDHYPERLGLLVCINSPPALAWSWKIISSWLTERQQQKIYFCANKNDALAALKPHLDPHIIPEECGGIGPPLQFT